MEVKAMRNYEDASPFDIIDEFVYIIDMENYEMLYMNKRGRESFGLNSEEDYRGKRCYEVLRHFDAPCMVCGAAGMDMSKPCSWMSNNKILNEYHFVQDFPIRFKGRDARVEMSVDVTEQVLQRQQLKAALDTETVMLEAIHILNTSLNFGEGVTKMLEYIGICFGATRTYLFERSGEVMKLSYGWHRSDVPVLPDKFLEIPLAAMPQMDNLLKNNEAFFTNDAMQLEGADGDTVRERFKFQSFIMAPLLIEGEVAGFIGLSDPVVEEVSSLKVMVMTLAYFTALSMVNAGNREALELLSYSDSMSGTANRNAFIRDKRHYEEAFSLEPDSIGVIYFDINGLKQVNDSEGHEAGDALIVTLGNVLTTFFRREEVYRIGGDEFVIMAPGIPQPVLTDRVAKIVRHIRENTTLSVSVGVAWSGGAEVDVDAVVSEADAAMYEEKQKYYNSLKPHSGK